MLSISSCGSLWYPDFEEFAINNAPQTKVPIYLSIGEKEKNSKNTYLQTTEAVTRRLAEHFRSHQHACIFELNPGNHFVDASLRQAKGIKWAMEQIVGSSYITNLQRSKYL